MDEGEFDAENEPDEKGYVVNRVLDFGKLRSLLDDAISEHGHYPSHCASPLPNTAAANGHHITTLNFASPPPSLGKQRSIAGPAFTSPIDVTTTKIVTKIHIYNRHLSSLQSRI